MKISLEIEGIVGGYKIRGTHDGAGDPLLGEAYASTARQVPARIKVLLESFFAPKMKIPDSTP